MLAGMSSTTLSAAIEKQIRRLCLNDFPCGNGSWRKPKDNEEAAETEDTGALLDLLSCPHSPWMYDESWSPQAPALRQLAVLAPERLHAAFIYSYFTTLRIVDKGVSVIDSGLLKFSKLEELVLSANKISEIPVENLPSTLKILELRANSLSALNRLTSRPPPPLRYLSLGSNCLGSHEDISNLTGRHWPQLVCLDLSDCEFQDQQVLMNALSTLPHLRTLVLEGNPLTLASCYPGFTVESLPQLSYLDGSWISPEERQCFRGLAKMSDLIVDQASVTVRVGRMRGIPDPMMRVDNSTPDFPVVTYRYSITYEFLSHQTPVNLKFDSGTKSDAAATAHVTEGCSSDADLPSSKTCEKDTCRHDTAYVSRHSTSKLSWSECMDFSDTQTHNITDLRGLKRFLNQGFYLRIEEEKVLSWPAVSEDVTMSKTSQTVKEKKGRKESAIKSSSTKDKPKDKKKKSVPELVQDTPVRRLLGSVHVPLQSLITGGEKVDVLCELGSLHVESAVAATRTLDKDLRKKIKEDKKKEDKQSKCRGGKEDGRKKFQMDVLTENSVELRVELQRWQSASEARQLLLPHQSS
ncbi:leucine-rich repeat-containing protein 43 isoform X2 [Sparus aurata]|uniref:leucine-rich repeat-containing protein 43 isoform X2 n=1 Tax=Sparus aurata TaxID=8175 RepID=UPI0011C1A44D|nr:leucine-rich repeat-containing protein 43 isoform X2 [Sparus aurata]